MNYVIGLIFLLVKTIFRPLLKSENRVFFIEFLRNRRAFCKKIGLMVFPNPNTGFVYVCYFS